MPLYETTYIARQDISQADVEKMNEQFSGIVTENKGKIVKTEYWGLRNLAYRINKSRKGHYTLFGIDAPSDALKELERRMRLNDDVIRMMSIRVENISKEPSAPLNAGRDSRDSRDSRDGGSRHGGSGRPHTRTNRSDR